MKTTGFHLEVLPFRAGGQLLDSPTSRLSVFHFPVVGLSGLEPPTSRLSGVRSNRLSYKPIDYSCRQFFIPALVEMNGFEPMTPCLQSRCSPS